MVSAERKGVHPVTEYAVHLVTRDGLPEDLTFDISRINLTGGNFTGSILSRTKLAGAILTGADFTDADFSQAEGLTQEQLDTACQHPNGPPPRNLPDGLTWDEHAAKARWHKWHGQKSQG